jgi:hypothetical protein
MKAIFLGAGSSCGTVGAPVAAHFGRALHAIDNDWRTTYSALAAIAQHLGLARRDNEWGLEAVWSCMDYYAKLHRAIGQPAPWWCQRNCGWDSPDSRELKKSLLRVYGTIQETEVDAIPVDAAYTLVKILRDAQPGDAVISFNYDTVAERLANRMGVGLCAAGRGDIADKIVFAKPHGSLTWQIDLRHAGEPGHVTTESGDGKPLLTLATAEDIDDFKEPLVLGAVPIKSELILEVQERFRVPEVFRTIQMQWRAVVHSICAADKLLVLGYSFPPEDQYGRFLMQEGVRQRHGRVLDIDFYDLPGSQAQTAKQIDGVFGSCRGKLSYCGPVTRPAVP